MCTLSQVQPSSGTQLSKWGRTRQHKTKCTQLWPHTLQTQHQLWHDQETTQGLVGCAGHGVDALGLDVKVDDILNMQKREPLGDVARNQPPFGIPAPS